MHVRLKKKRKYIKTEHDNQSKTWRWSTQYNDR